MGRIRTKLIKRVGSDLVRAHADRFTEDFAKNKPVVREKADVPSKKMRNVIAGYVTKLMKNREEL